MIFLRIVFDIFEKAGIESRWSINLDLLLVLTLFKDSSKFFREINKNLTGAIES